MVSIVVIKGEYVLLGQSQGLQISCDRMHAKKALSLNVECFIEQVHNGKKALLVG